MRIGVATSNSNFLGGILHELDETRAHDVLLYTHTEDAHRNAFNLGQLCAGAETLFCDFVQYPTDALMASFGGRIVVRAHRLEMYQTGIEAMPWDRCETLVFIAEHVRQRFMARLTGKRPRNVRVVNGVGVDTSVFKPPAVRDFGPPYRILIAGNLVPKKRVYTAVQMLADLPDDFRLVIVGDGGKLPGYGNDEYVTNVQDLIAELDIRGRIEPHESMPQSKLAELMGTCAFVLSSSNEEGCHSTIAEAMTCGCVPLMGPWRGAKAVYPEAWHWRSFGEFNERTAGYAAMTGQDRMALSGAQMVAAQRYASGVVNSELADAICGPVDSAAAYDAHVPHQVSQWGNPRQRRCYDLLRQFAGPGARYLDVGCGAGYCVVRAADDGMEAHGIDASMALLQQGAYRAGQGAAWHQVDVTREGIPVGPWSAVSMFDSMEHIPSDARQRVCGEIVANLEPGGVFIVTVPWQTGDPAQPQEWPVYPKTVRQFLLGMGCEELMYGALDDTYFVIAVRKPGGEAA